MVLLGILAREITVEIGSKAIVRNEFFWRAGMMNTWSNYTDSRRNELASLAISFDILNPSR